MESALKFLIVVGLIMWLFVMYEKTHPIEVFDKENNVRIEKVNGSECSRFASSTGSGGKTDYRDQIRRVFAGCW